MNFLDTACNGVHANLCEPYAPIWSGKIISRPDVRLVPFPHRLIMFISELGVQNTVCGTIYRAHHLSTLLEYVLQVVLAKNFGMITTTKSSGRYRSIQ